VNLLLTALLLATAAPATPSLTEPAPERVVFHTVAGDLVFALYPNAAPQTVKQFLTLVQAGVYDTTMFARMQAGFIAQVSSASNRTKPLTPEQAGLIRRLPVEASALVHARGLLSMARKDNDPDSAETSFCIMLGPAPQLDGKYTIFGRLESGDDVIKELLKVPTDDRRKPKTRLEIMHAETTTVDGLAKMKLVPAHAIAGALAPSAVLHAAAARPEAEPAIAKRDVPIAIGLVLIILLGLAKFLLRSRLSPRAAVSLDLLVILVSAFLLFVLLTPVGQDHPWLGLGLFFGLLGLFKALGRFESAA
jgi:cyclophilin family peptidyl-prolyl cis-trans isomerase